MLYDLKQGPTEVFLIDQAKRQRQPVPEAIRNAPVLQAGLQFFYSAFWTLSSCRPVGMGEGRIPWHAVNEYSLRYGLDDVELDHLWVMITTLDGEYLKFNNKKNEQGAIGNKPKPPPAKPPIRKRR